MTLETDRAGRRVAVKHVGSTARARAEAAFLQALRHPGTVEVLRLDEHDDGSGAVLVLGAVDGPSLGDVELPPDALAAVSAALATTVADLHARGVVHGVLRGEHVLLDGGRTPRICGFGAAATRPDGAPSPTPPDDVYDLALLLRDGLARWRLAHGDTVPPDARSLADRVDRVARRVLLAPAGRRCSARELAARLGQLPGVRLPGTGGEAVPDDPAGSAVRQAPRARGMDRNTVLAAACMAISLAVCVVAVPRITARLSRPAEVRPRAAAASPSTRRKPAPTTSTLPPPSPCPTRPPAVLVDPDGDRCGEPATVEGRRIRTPSGLFEVGDDGDQLALGDWDCDGLATPAVVRPATGGVFLFSGWPTSVERPGARVATVPGATAAHAVRAVGTGCDRLVVDRATGPSRMVDARAAS